jgi:hypothetical protein
LLIYQKGYTPCNRIPEVERVGTKVCLRYFVAAAAATAAAAALFVASARVPWLAAFFSALGGPGLWLKYALCFAAPAVLWAAALAKLAPRVALRVAGVFAQKWFVYLVVALSTMGAAYAAWAVLGDAPLNAAASTSLFQSKIFCRGRLAAPAPPTEADLARAFFRSRGEVVRFGRWFSASPPLHPALLCLGRAAGWPKFIPVIAAAITLFAVYALGRRALGPFGGAVAALLAATSPLFIFTQASYSSQATFVCFFALAAWACWEVGRAPTRKAALALGAAFGAAILVYTFAAIYLALPFAWYLWRRERQAGGVDWLKWFAAGLVPFLAAWILYNLRQTGNVFLPPRFFADEPYFGFGDGYAVRDALTAAGRGLVALSTSAFGWPLLGLVPAVWRLFWRPRPNDFEKTLYAAASLTVVAQLPVRDVGAGFGGGFYYPAWFCLAFITAQFFVILSAKAQRRFSEAGEGLAAFVLVALVSINAAAYLPLAARHYVLRARRVAVSPWAEAVNRRVAAVIPGRAVVIVKPRAACSAVVPGSPFLDDRVVFARDNGESNRDLVEIFPGREFYLLDYPAFKRTGEITPLEVK